MTIVEVRGGPVTKRYLMNKTKEDLAGEHLQVLDVVDRLRDRLARAEGMLREVYENEPKTPDLFNRIDAFLSGASDD